MLLICFLSSIVALIIKTGSNTIVEHRCDLSLRCMNDSISVPVINSAALKCIKRKSCPILDDLTCTINQINKIHIHLKDIRIKQKKNGYWIQVKLGSYDLIKHGNQSFLVKFSIEEDHACYQFSIPLFLFTSSKDILLPCFRVQMLQRNNMRVFLSVHQETDEVIAVQGMKYSLSNVSDGRWLGGSVFESTHDFDDDLIYFSLNVIQDSGCSFNNSIAFYKSYPNDCSIKQAPIYTNILPPDLRLNISRDILSSCQNYCIYVVSSKNQQCGTLHPKNFIDVAFIQLPSTISSTVPVNTDVLHTDVHELDCEKWNFTIDVKIIEKNIIATVLLWPEYELCFSSYNMHLYNFPSPTCDTELEHPAYDTFKFEAGPNNKEIIKVYKNVTVGYYCILVVPFLDEFAEIEWARDSGSFNVSETLLGNNTEVDKRKEKPNFDTKVIIAISFLIFFTAFALWSCSEHIRRSKTKTDKVFPKKSNEKEERESMPLLTLATDSVYLFHAGDDDPLADKVRSLRHFLLEEAQFNVNDVHVPEYLKQSNRYISELLKCDCSGEGPTCTSKKKFIVVISEKVLRYYHESHFIWKFNEEKAFREMLEFIRVLDWGTAYCHLFLVAFNEGIFNDPRFKSFFPMTTYGAYYVLPNELINLCVKLNSSSSRCMPIEKIRARLEQHDIRNAGSE